MIITGNSNIDCFNRQGFRAAAEGEQVHIYWVGALKIRHFFEGRPIGEKVRRLLSGEKGWKLLSIGTHDIFELYLAASRNTLDETLRSLLACYTQIFTEFRDLGNFGWLVFPQPFHQFNVENITEQEKLLIARRFNRKIEGLCAEKGILVVNPLKKMMGSNGNPLTVYLQDDRSHLSQEGAALYLQEIKASTRVQIAFQPKQILFEPQTENESFCSLLLNNLHMPVGPGLSKNDLISALTHFLQDLLQQKGSDVTIDPYTELVGSRLVNSLDLVETFSFATDAMQMDITFDVNLWDLSSVEKMATFLINQKYGLNGKDRVGYPMQSDFLLSLRGDFTDPVQRGEILESECRIAMMDERSLESFKENVVVASEGYTCPYGIILFWVALNHAQHGDYQDALSLLVQASSPRRKFPFSDPRVPFYRKMWQKMATPRIWEQEIDPSILEVMGSRVGDLSVSRNSQRHDSLSSTVNEEVIAAYNDAIALAQGGDDEGAVGRLESLLGSHPDFDLAHNALGTLYCKRGEKVRALNRYQSAVRLKPDNIAYLKNMADFYHKEMGESEKAIPIYVRVLKSNPGDLDTLLAIGDISIFQKKFEHARRVFEKVLEIDHENKSAEEKLGSLRKDETEGGSGDSGKDVCTRSQTSENRAIEKETYLVSALVSTYNSERFMRGCLEDLETQTIADKIEIIVIDSCSQENERSIVEEFQKKYQNVVYVRTEQREKLYAAWNRGIRMARGKYITNANTDDRRVPYAFEVEARALDMFPNVGLVYGDIWSTDIENDTLAPEGSGRHTLCVYPDFTLLDGLKGSHFSPQPMWRKSAHEEVGYFDEKYIVAGDYEFFFRLSRRYNALHIRAPLGLYLENPEGIQISQPEQTTREFRRLRKKFYSDIPLEEFFPDFVQWPDEKVRGFLLWELGNNCMSASMEPELEMALDYYRQAEQILGEKPPLMHNLAICLIRMGDVERGKQILEKTLEELPSSRGALEILEKGMDFPSEYPLYEHDHPLSKAAHTGLGIDLEKLLKAGNQNYAAGDICSGREQNPLTVVRASAVQPWNERILDEKERVKELHEQAILMEAKGEREGALEHLMLILKIDENNPEVHNDLGVLYFQKENFEEAILHLREAVRLDPGNIDYGKNLADIYLHTGRAEEAFEYYRSVLEKKPDDVDVSLALAHLCSHAGLKDRAKYYVGRVLEIEPENVNAKNFFTR